MADDTKLDQFRLLEQLQTKRSWRSHPIPETLKELNAVKKQLLDENFGHIQKAFLIKALRASNGNITRAAQRVGMQRPNFCTLLKKHRISPERIKDES